jgi:Cu/Ag efflux protein CusF
MRSLLLLAALLSASEWTLGQSRSRPDPTSPSAGAPPPSYESTFSDYQPFRDEKVRSWKEVNKEVADNPAMGAMKHGPGMTMPGMDSKTGDAAKAKEGTPRQDMGSMEHKPGAAMPGMDSKAGAAQKGKEGTAGHDMGSMKDKPGAAMAGMDSKAGNAQKGKEGAAGHDMGSMKDKPGAAMPGMDKPAASTPKNITGTGSVQLVDKANGKVKLTHEPIAAMGWPKMTLFFRLKERSLADQVKEGDRVAFTLEKSASGYVISGFQKPISESNPTVNVAKPAGHGKH